MRDVYEVLKEKGITLPQPPAKGGVYTPVQELGEKFLYCSGCGPDLGNGNTVVGKLGKDLTVEDGQKAAYNCVLNLLANLNEKTGDLNRIKRFVKVLAFVNSANVRSRNGEESVRIRGGGWKQQGDGRRAGGGVY